MGPDLSSLELPAIVEHMQAALAIVRLRLAEPGPMTPADRACAAAHVRVLAATLGNLQRVVHRPQRPTDSPKGGNQATGKAVDTRGHSCECLCEGCERNGTGYFAQRAALDGDPSAADRLSVSIYAVLSAERASRRAPKRKAEAA